MKKYWKIISICVAASFILCYYLFIRKREIDSADPENAVNKLQEGLAEIKEKIQEATNVATVEAAVAKKELVDVKKELNEAAKIKDAKERRNKLADLATRSEEY